MSKQAFARKLPWLILLPGCTCLTLRWLLHRVAVDGRGLLITGHPLALLLGLLTCGTLLFILLYVRHMDVSGTYHDHFSPSIWAAAGHIPAALGILFSALSAEPMIGGPLGQCWRFLGIASCPCLLTAGVLRLLGRKPFFLLHMLPCLFLVFHIINHYQQWSSEPQLLNCIYPVLASICLMFFAFYTGAFEADIPHPRFLTGMGLAAIFLCCGALILAETDFWLYLGGIIWAVTGLCAPYCGHTAPAAVRENRP